MLSEVPRMYSIKKLSLVAVSVASSLMVPTAFAATSGTLQGSMNIGYSCDITIPSTTTLTPSGTTGTGSALLPYSQNANTDYTLSALTISGPAGASLTGTISIRDGSASEVVNNSSTSASSSGQLTGNTSGTGSVVYTINETGSSAFLSGNYTISSVLTCSQS